MNLVEKPKTTPVVPNNFFTLITRDSTNVSSISEIVEKKRFSLEIFSQNCLLKIKSTKKISLLTSKNCWICANNNALSKVCRVTKQFILWSFDGGFLGKKAFTCENQLFMFRVPVSLRNVFKRTWKRQETFDGVTKKAVSKKFRMEPPKSFGFAWFKIRYRKGQF